MLSFVDDAKDDAKAIVELLQQACMRLARQESLLERIADSLQIMITEADVAPATGSSGDEAPATVFRGFDLTGLEALGGEVEPDSPEKSAASGS